MVLAKALLQLSRALLRFSIRDAKSKSGLDVYWDIL